MPAPYRGGHSLQNFRGAASLPYSFRSPPPHYFPGERCLVHHAVVQHWIPYTAHPSPRAPYFQNSLQPFQAFLPFSCVHWDCTLGQRKGGFDKRSPGEQVFGKPGGGGGHVLNGERNQKLEKKRRPGEHFFFVVIN